MIEFEDFLKLEIKIGTILSAEPIEGSEKLLKLEVNLGEEKSRQVIAGIAKKYKPADLINKQAVFLANLKPRTLMGLESNGMILAGHDENNLPVILCPSENVPNGSLIS